MSRPWVPCPRLLLSMALSGALAAAACSGQAPTAPETAVSVGSGLVVDETGGGRASAASVDGNQFPSAVFRTRPPADSEGVIAGGAAVDVTFNLCQTTDPDPGDELRFSYDFNGDGTVDQIGHCRATQRYEVAAFESECMTAVVCVTDRQPEHRVCETYQVCAKGRSREPAGPSGPEEFTEQAISGDLTPYGSRDSFAFGATAGTRVTIEVDTVSEDTAYWMNVCVSTTHKWTDCLRPETKARVACSYPTPGNIGCPHKTTVLPTSPDGIYYVIAGGDPLHAVAGRLRRGGAYVAGHQQPHPGHRQRRRPPLDRAVARRSRGGAPSTTPRPRASVKNARAAPWLHAHTST